MNQILLTNEEKRAKTRDIKPIIKFFCGAAIIFAVILVFEGGLALYNRFNGNSGLFNKNNTASNNTNNQTISSTGSTGDTKKPVISIEMQNGKLQITAMDETELDYFSYQWEGSEEVKVNPSEEDKTIVKQELEVKKGTAKLILTAVDKAGNKETTTKKIIGSNGPVISASLADGNIVVKVTDEFGITKIVYTHNDEEHTVEGIPEGAKEFEFKVPLKEGDNYLKINAYENGIMTEFKCKKTK